MAELLLNYSADPTVLDVSRLNETMSRVLKRELSVLDSSDNENNDDESMSPLSPLTSDNDDEKNDDKQHFHSKLVEELDKNLASHSASAKVQRKKVRRTRCFESLAHVRFALPSLIVAFVSVRRTRPTRRRTARLARPVAITTMLRRQPLAARIPTISKAKKREKYVNPPMKYVLDAGRAVDPRFAHF